MVSVVWHHSLPLINSCNKTEAAVFPCGLWFRRPFFLSLILYVKNMYLYMFTYAVYVPRITEHYSVLLMTDEIGADKILMISAKLENKSNDISCFNKRHINMIFLLSAYLFCYINWTSCFEGINYIKRIALLPTKVPHAFKSSSLFRREEKYYIVYVART